MFAINGARQTDNSIVQAASRDKLMGGERELDNSLTV